MNSIKSMCGIVTLIFALLMGNIAFAEEEVGVLYNGEKLTFDVNPSRDDLPLDIYFKC